MRVVITGGAGFLGRRLGLRLAERGTLIAIFAGYLLLAVKARYWG